MIVDNTFARRFPIFVLFTIVVNFTFFPFNVFVWNLKFLCFHMLFVVKWSFFFVCIDQQLRYPWKCFYVEFNQTSCVATEYLKALIFYVLSDWSINSCELPCELFSALTFCDYIRFAHSTVRSLTLSIFD